MPSISLSPKEHCNEDDGSDDDKASVAAVPPLHPGQRGGIGVEYAVLVGVVVVGIGAALGTFQNQIKAGLAAAGGKIAGINGLK